MNPKAKRNTRKRTDIKVPEPRHRVGPKGVSSGISFRDLPPPSLDQIKKICEHYQEKCAGTYKSLASRYVYQMATEIEGLVEALKQDGSMSESSYPISEDHVYAPCDERGEHHGHRERRSRPKSTKTQQSEQIYERHESQYGRMHPQEHRRGHYCKDEDVVPGRRRSSTSYYTSADEDFEYGSSHQHRPSTDREFYDRRSSANSMSMRNLEDQNKEVLRWLKEEMDRSQELLMRSKQLHEAELDDAKQELQKVKKAAKMIIKAVHKKGKEKAAKSEAHAEFEKKRRERSQRIIDDLIQSHSNQIDLLKKGLRHRQRHSSKSERGSKHEDSFHLWGEPVNKSESVWEDPREVCSLMDDSDLTSVLDELAEEAYLQSCCSVQSGCF